MLEEILEYTRKRRGGCRIKTGVLIARKVGETKKKENKVLVGWSKCNLRMDKFDNERGIKIARNRIEIRLSEKRKKTKVPHSLQDKVDHFVERVKRYYKTKKVVVV